MRIDLPSCPLKSCRYCNDGNCTDAKSYEDCILRDMVQIPQNATNGDIIKAMFPNFRYKDIMPCFVTLTDEDANSFTANKSWFNAQFKAGGEK